MSDLDKRISDALEKGAKYLVMGEIAAHTGLLVSPAPLDDTDYDIIVNNIDLSKGCMIEVLHSRDEFNGYIRGSDFDFLIFVYAPSIIEKIKNIAILLLLNKVKAFKPKVSTKDFDSRFLLTSHFGRVKAYIPRPNEAADAT